MFTIGDIGFIFVLSLGWTLILLAKYMKPAWLGSLIHAAFFALLFYIFYVLIESEPHLPGH